MPGQAGVAVPGGRQTSMVLDRIGRLAVQQHRL